MSAVDYGRNALDFIESLEAYTSVSDAMAALGAGFGRFGFETIVVSGLPNPDQRIAPLVLAKRWPAEWFKMYTEKNYDRVDPVVRMCRQSINPFEWSEAPFDPVAEPHAAEVMNRASEYGMSRGFIVPIHGLTGYQALVSLGGIHLDLNPRSKPALHLMAMYGFERIRRLVEPKAPPQASLTRREREAISWAALGKSAWEIGEILHITQRTAEEHLAVAARKLGAVNRTHAVAIAIRRNIIHP
jgi:LuxR family transcriptional regulator, quorum-sensing system regulator BjaR1